MSIVESLRRREPEDRQAQIVDVLVEAFADLMRRSPAEFRRRFRKMASDPFAFYRGSACLYYADIVHDEDPWADERTSRVWIQGDLHAENFGTYMNDDGVFVFDVNDFDEAYVGHFTWDIKRLVASVALLAWIKAISDDDIRRLIAAYVRAYVDQVRYFHTNPGDSSWAITLDNAEGYVREVLIQALASTRIELLERKTLVEEHERRFKSGPGVRRLDDAERAKVEAAFTEYLDTIPAEKRFSSITYRVKDIIGSFGFGIGSAGLSAYNILVEGRTQALENDVILSMKQGNVAAPSRVVDDARIREFFLHHGHRTAVSRRALQANTDPWLGHTQIDGVGYVVQELSPYEEDLDWSGLTEPAEMLPLLEDLGRATAKIHCVSDRDSDHSLVDFQVEDAIMEVIGRTGEDAFVDAMVSFGMGYAEIVRDDHRLFVDAFRSQQGPLKLLLES
ncbi:DUF2252 domain-containing protein [Thermomonospora cellulosilytica]|uniref:Uncharacterized protein (DUF2252 family) n=1 Tax=Thermomonospora cellulosilytica TaxID=1411118 RepID=A0A7W3N1J2_9ACTN|nr:DUF2252 domain-containing protein [Thermomonospora cellulosilytica]MBA9005826.1 uncharacterized protein (DUF2252 family) [Thermomonospora cellulosilytica]